MAQVSVDCKIKDDSWLCKVRVKENGSETSHTVSVRKADYERLAQGQTLEELVRKSFDFLLARERKENILREFDLMEIAKYFPEFEDEILTI